MRLGDKIRLVRVPPTVRDDGEFKTRTILTKCVGRTFTVRGFQDERGMTATHGSQDYWIDLDMREVIPGTNDTIWVEPDCVELLRRSTRKQKRAK